MKDVGRTRLKVRIGAPHSRVHWRCRSRAFYRVPLYLPPLSREEEHRLGLLARHGDDSARKRLIESGFILVFEIASQFRDRGVAFDDLVQEGLVALCEAVDRWDPAREARLVSLAVLVITHHLLEKVAAQSGPVRCSRETLTLRRRIFRAERDIEQAQGGPATAETVAAALGVPECKVIAASRAGSQIDLDAVTEAEDPVFEVAGMDCPPAQETILEDSACASAVQWLVAQLPREERRVIKVLYGLSHRGMVTWEEARRILKMSNGTLGRRKEQAFVRLRGAVGTYGLCPSVKFSRSSHFVAP